ncbi:MAG: PAS domain S-box protein [Candidatus Binatia bacterium]
MKRQPPLEEKQGQYGSEELRLLLKITQAISESNDFHSALRVALQMVCETTGWDFGEAWIPCSDGTALEYGLGWCGDDRKLEEFRLISEGFTFLPGLGLPGRVWSSKQPEWVENVSTEPDTFHRAKIAIKAGLRSALAFPIVAEDQALAVLVFFMFESHKENRRLFEIVSTVANQLGSLIQRKRVEEALYRTRAELESRVQERTQALAKSNKALQQEILERTQTEEELRRERDFAESLIKTAQAIVLVLDSNGRIVRFNPFMEKISGYRLAEVKGKDWFTTFLPERDQELIRGLFLSVWNNLERHGVNPIITRDHHERQIEWFSKTLKDTDGNTIGVLSVGQDITDRKRAEAWMRSLIETTQDAVISADQQGRIVLFNPAAEQIFGYSKTEIQGQKVDMLMAEDYAMEHDDTIARYRQTGEKRAIGRTRTLTGRRKGGEEFPIELSITEVATDEEARYAAFIRDISEKTRLQQQLVESERLAAIGTTAAKFAHEIGNPLNSMSMAVQLLERRLARQGDVVDKSVGSIVRNLTGEISRLNFLLHDFSSLSRREKYSFQPTSLAAVVAEVLEMETPRYTELGIRVEQDFPSDLPLVVADGGRLKQALLNLCKNASEAMPHGGILKVRAYRSRGQIVLEVMDTGVGISPGVDIFKPFTTAKALGTGLGLMVVRQIVSAHGGSITYNSELGKGTVFRLTLRSYLSDP